MTRPLAALVSLTCVPVLAAGWLPVSWDVPIAARWMFGATATIAIAAGLHGIGVGFGVTIAAVAMCVAVGSLHASTVVEGIRHASRRERVVAALVSVPLLCAVLFTISTPVDAGDALMAWYAKARDLVAWRPLAALAYPEYPDFATLGWSLLLRISGWAWEPFARLVFVAASAAFALSLTEMLDRPLSAHAIWAVPLGVLATFDLRLMTNGYQDAVVGAIAGLSAVLLASSLRTGIRSRALLGLFFAGVLGTIKLEGLVIGVLLVSGWVVVQRARPLRDAWAWAGLAVCAALALWWPLMLWMHGVDTTRGQYDAFRAASLLDIPGRLGRLPIIARAFVATGPRFLLPLGAVLVLSVSAAVLSSRLRSVLAFLGLVAAGHSAAIVLVFLLTDLDVNWHLATALDRLVLQQAIGVWTPAMIVSAVCLADLAMGELT